MYEHAYHIDFGAAAGAYVDAFMHNVDWTSVYARYQHAVHQASDALAAGHADVAGKLVLDVRRAGVFEAAQSVIPGASWRDPAAVAEWAQAIPRDAEVLVYCVYGHEVGRATAMRLRAAGLNARFLEGGIDRWESSGQAVEPRGASA